MLSRLGPFMVLLAEVVLFYRKVLFGRYAIPWDLRYYHLPQLSFIAKCFREGTVPLWNPYPYCGMPWYAKIDSQLFYPPTTVALLLSNVHAAGRHLLFWLELQTIAHVLLAGFFAYWLIRRLGTGRAASLAGATVYQLGAFFASQIQHQGAVDAAAWMPLVWLAILELAERPSRRWVAVLALALTMAILSGFPAVTAVVAASAVWLALALIGMRRARPGMALYVGLAGAWAGLLAAVQLLPAIELSRLSHAALRGQIGDGGGIPPAALLTLISPNHFGILQFPGHNPYPLDPTFLYLYCGAPALLLAAYAVVRRTSKYTIAFFAVMVLSTLWMLGKYTPAWKYGMRLVPSAVRGALYIEFSTAAFTLALAVLAGLGADAVLKSRPAWVKTLVVAAIAADLILVSSGRAMNATDAAAEPGLGYDHFDAYTEVPARMRELVNRNTPPWRIDTFRGSPQWNNGSTLFEIPTAGGDDPFAPLRILRFRLLFCEGNWWERAYQVARLDSPLLSLANVRYVLSEKPTAAGVLEKLPGPQYVYENAAVLPRFFLVGRVRQVSGLEAALAFLNSPEFNPRREAVVEGAGPVPSASGSGGNVQVVEYEPNRVTLQTESRTPAYLVTSESYYPGWRAWVDGREQPLLITNAAFRGLPVPAGKHRVTMRFAPRILWYGAALSAAAWVALLAMLAKKRA